MYPRFNYSLALIAASSLSVWYLIWQKLYPANSYPANEILVWPCLIFVCAVILSMLFFAWHGIDKKNLPALTVKPASPKIYQAVSERPSFRKPSCYKRRSLNQLSDLKLSPLVSPPLVLEPSLLRPKQGYRSLSGKYPLITLLNSKLIVAWFERINFSVSIRCDLGGLAYINENHLSEIIDNLLSRLFHDAFYHNYAQVALDISLKNGYYYFSFYTNGVFRQTKIRQRGQKPLPERPLLRSSGLYELHSLLNRYEGYCDADYIRKNHITLKLPERKNLIILPTRQKNNF